MAHHQHHHHHREHQVPKLQTFLKMVFSSDQPSLSADQDIEVVDEGDEPPDQHRLHNRHNHDQPYIKSPPIMAEKKESLLTRALLRSPDLAPADRARKASYPTSNASGHSTAELTSDGDLTSPAYSNTSSPPHPSTIRLAPAVEPASPPSDPNESKVEADLGRKRCISFACARQPQRTTEPEKKKINVEPAKPLQRRTTLTFACPTRQSEARPATKRTQSYNTSRPNRSPAPSSRRPSPDSAKTAVVAEPKPAAPANKKPGSIHMTGLGDFQPSEETRFHEFASSLDEVDGWVAQATEYQQKITLADCMKKEMAIRKLGEEAEAEAIAEEEEEDDIEDDDDDEQEEDINDDEDAETVNDESSDDGNESDNEAGFADSDDEDDGNSEYEFWAPSTTTAATSTDNLDLVRLAAERRNSNTSIDSLKRDDSLSRLSPAGPKGKIRRAINIPRAPTPDLPDSTDFVCGTLDEDRPLEVAYISCIEERRRKKHVPVPQDIDPSFPTTDPEDNEDDIEEEDEEDEEEHQKLANAARIEDDLLRGRSKGTTKKNARTSPRRLHSPPPRAHGQVSPKRAKSPAPPKARQALAAGLPSIAIPVRVNITGPVQRPYYSRTKSLPRTPNPFFMGLEGSRHSAAHHESHSVNSIEGAVSRSREPHTRGPIDIIQGLERKRQKRKEKFWRQHCRKAAAKEQSERRAARGKGAERMKELGLEVAERFKAYGVGKDTQLMLSV